MNWEPAHADHSIESVNVTLWLASPVEPDLFDEMLVAARRAANNHQFIRRVEAIEPLQLQQAEQIIIDLANVAPRRRVAFQKVEDEKPIAEFAVGASSIGLMSARY